MSTEPARTPPSDSGAGRLGTFAGVFTPSILTILGIILFQRLGFVVGAGGLVEAIGIILLATAISLVTSISLAAIATNMRVRGGGDYFLISRTLGVEYGGAIGVVLFIAQAVSIAFYCIGFGEATAAMLGKTGDAATISLIAATATLIIAGIAFIGADLATKFQFFVMIALGVALGSFFVGGVLNWDNALLGESLRASPRRAAPPFWLIFAVFFPAVTGFTQGVSMSGDLRDPSRSLPRGTFLAVGISTVVYLGAAVVFAANLPLDVLASDYGAMRKVAVAPWLIEVGVIAATLSSAMASCLGAPRILQALATDKIIPPLNMFAAGAGSTNNPRRAVLLAAGIALATVGLGNLNAVAAVVGMCFLLSYGLLNYATFVEARAHSPAFRPTFRWFNAWLSLAGAALCLFAGAMINPFAAAIAGAALLALYQYLRRAEPPGTWADSRYAYHFRRVRDHLLEMRGGSRHARDWRPFVLALCNEPIDRVRLLTFAAWIDGESGFTTAARVLTPGKVEARGEESERAPAVNGKRLAEAEESLRAQVQEAGLETFTRIVWARTVSEGLAQLLQAHGLGPVRPNTILMSAHEQFGDEPRMGDAPPPEALAAALGQRKNLILLEGDSKDWTALENTPEEERRIDVWWKDGDTSRLCLLLAHLMTRAEGWRDAEVRVHVINPASAGRDEALGRVREMLDDVRIDAEADLVDFTGPESLVEHSKGASVVFLPLRVRGGRLTGPRGGLLMESMSALPVCAMVVAGEDIDLDAQPDEPAPDATEESPDAAAATDGDAAPAPESAPVS
ncbi:MAG TPA: amino acid permease [Phycisphaerales bacterium]|nr:amino acid permease [Phycisphaerales bacterium]